MTKDAVQLLRAIAVQCPLMHTSITWIARLLVSLVEATNVLFVTVVLKDPIADASL